ncbi:MAG: YraN family protein [Desulfobacteraceae bacterium 4572_35.1]|nr:MAG: YraN family protein [Desulfobacteraceae bacterium 4572_35.1]
MTQQRLSLGRWGEQQAVCYLRRRLYRIVATNYSCRGGEIDIIAQRGGILAFVEVKTRRGTAYGTGGEAVNERKQRQIIRAAQWYLASQPSPLQPRFDVISILVSGAVPVIDHVPNAFTL